MPQYFFDCLQCEPNKCILLFILFTVKTCINCCSSGLQREKKDNIFLYYFFTLRVELLFLFRAQKQEKSLGWEGTSGITGPNFSKKSGP